MTGDFCILGRVKTLFVPWISPIDIGGNNRVECNFFNLLSLLGEYEGDIIDFQKKNKGFLTSLSLSLTLMSLVKIDLYKSCGSSFSGVDMPGHLFSSDPCFSLAVDQWPNPTTCTWFLSGIASRKLACSTKNCGFKCNYPHELKKHQEKCTDQVSIVARNRTYG